MTTPTKFLWLALPALVGVALWLAADRLTTTAARTDFWTLAGILLTATVVGYVAMARDAQPRGLRKQPASTIHVAQSLQLPDKYWLHAVEFDGKTLLIGSGGGRLVRLDDTAKVARPADVERAASDEGVDLRDTPRDLEEFVDTPRSLARALGAESVHRAGLNESSLADFKRKVAAARAGATR